MLTPRWRPSPLRAQDHTTGNAADSAHISGEPSLAESRIVGDHVRHVNGA
jgi:hypothetical protein